MLEAGSVIPNFTNYFNLSPIVGGSGIRWKMGAINTLKSPHTGSGTYSGRHDHPNTAATCARALAQLGPSVDVVSTTSGAGAMEKVKNKGINIYLPI